MSLELKYFVLKPQARSDDIHALRDAIASVDQPPLPGVAPATLARLVDEARMSEAYARASRAAIRVFAHEIKDDDYALAHELNDWIDSLEAQD